MNVRYLDTQVVVWLYGGVSKRLAPARRELDGRELVISPMVLLELHYLYEIERLSAPGQDVVDELATSSGLRIANEPWGDVIRAALALSWTRDPFDRLIVAHTLVTKVPLVTADARILAHCPLAVWDRPSGVASALVGGLDDDG